MAAPGRRERHKPEILGVHHLAVEVALGELDDGARTSIGGASAVVAAVARAGVLRLGAGAGARGGGAGGLAGEAAGDNAARLAEGGVGEALSVALAVVVGRALLVGAENLDRGEALDLSKKRYQDKENRFKD